jgi:hypothetical protein
MMSRANPSKLVIMSAGWTLSKLKAKILLDSDRRFICQDFGGSVFVDSHYVAPGRLLQSYASFLSTTVVASTAQKKGKFQHFMGVLIRGSSLFPLGLPTEILEKFLDLLEDDSSLKSVRQTCRRFQELVSADMDKDIITRAICSFRNIESIVVEKSTGLQCLRRRSKLYTNTYQHTLLEPRGLNDWPDTVEKLGARSFSAVLEALVRAGTEEVDRKALRCISALGISWQVIERLEPMIPSLRNILSPVNDVALNFRRSLRSQRYPSQLGSNQCPLRLGSSYTQQLIEGLGQNR